MPDEIIGGYRLRGLLHPGQLSQVYEVVEVNSNRHYAMKILLPQKSKDPEQRKMLFHEADIGKKLHHPNVIRIFKVSKSESNPHFIMEFFPAGSLRSRILQKENDFLRQNASKILTQASTGLAYMHGKGFIHRDVKPDNFLINSLGELKLIDFAITKPVIKGIAKWFYRRSNKAQGTASYLSPEQIRDEMPSPAQDIYSFGVTLYELFSGRPPFRGSSVNDLLAKHIRQKPDTPQMHSPELTDAFCELVLSMLEKKPGDRPKSMHEVLSAARTMRVFQNQPITEPT